MAFAHIVRSERQYSGRELLGGGWHVQTAELHATAQSQAADVLKSPVVTSGAAHPGVVATKVGYFGVKSANVIQDQMGT